MAQYRKKPVVIEAVRWRGYTSNLGITVEAADNEDVSEARWEPIPEWLPKTLPVCETHESTGRLRVEVGEIKRHGEDLYIGTLEGEMCARPGDWIIRGVQGEIYPCKPDIFAATYDPA